MANPLPFKPLSARSTAGGYMPSAKLPIPPPGMFAPRAAPSGVTYHAAQGASFPHASAASAPAVPPPPPEHAPAPHEETQEHPTSAPNPIASAFSLVPNVDGPGGGGGGSGASALDTPYLPGPDAQAVAAALGGAAAGAVLHVKNNLPLYAVGASALALVAIYFYMRPS